MKLPSSESADLGRVLVSVSGSVAVLGGNSKFFSEKVTFGLCVGTAEFGIGIGAATSDFLETFDAGISRLKEILMVPSFLNTLAQPRDLFVYRIRYFSHLYNKSIVNSISHMLLSKCSRRSSLE